jgi:hypothetical protein
LPPELRKPRKKAPPTALTLIQERNAALQPRDDGAFTSPYSDQDKELAVTLYAITDSAPRAAEWWKRIKGTDSCPGKETILRWEKEDGHPTLPSLEAVEALKAVYKGRFIDQEVQTLEMAHEAVRGNLASPNKNLFYLNGVLMTVADRTRQVLYPAQVRQGETNVGVTVGFVTSGKERPGWDVEGEVKEVKEA